MQEEELNAENCSSLLLKCWWTLWATHVLLWEYINKCELCTFSLRLQKQSQANYLLIRAWLQWPSSPLLYPFFCFCIVLLRSWMQRLLIALLTWFCLYAGSAYIKICWPKWLKCVKVWWLKNYKILSEHPIFNSLWLWTEAQTRWGERKVEERKKKKV